MIKEVFATYDSKGGFYNDPFMVRSKGEAIRGFMTAANDPKTSIGQYPEDFTLFQLAQYDDHSGKYSNYDTPLSCGVAIEFVNKVTIKDNIVSMKN